MATAVKIYDFKTKKEDTLDLNPEIFDVEVKPEVMHQVVEAYLANRRSGTASAKTRSEVSGGGAKPWRQKGTGRARAGSNTSPLWKGGGVVFGPKPRSYEKKVNKKVRRLAMRMALSAKKDEMKVFKNFNVAATKTREAAKILQDASMMNALIVFNSKDEQVLRVTNNIEGIKVIGYNQLNVFDVLTYENLCMDEGVLETLNKELLK